ncbi:hypothetical protein C2845_PM11G18630 [Panicum miliaceum]|uniref:non-specific serine/threonine protein kinase n=1 Tax=Panicum miliaceum TaxID=4540 RepID=A0A3L6RU68_PANMI|nr:hypothetical protein C2845_PM11G18630 [Panicum miliaceum]
MVYFVYRCFRKNGLPSINVKATTARDGGAAEPTPPSLPDSVIRSTTIENFLNEIAREKPVRFSAQQLDGYTQGRAAELGAGGFGAVYKGMLPNGLDVAVKVLHEHMGGEVTEQQFMAEVGTLWRTNHANLIRLIGFCSDADGTRALVYEFMPNRSLDRFLFDRRHAVGPATLLAVAAGVARGLRYLHEECQKKIIHYDVKAGNVLLDDTLTPKLTDFGIAQLLSRAAASARRRRFGMLLFEVVGRRKNMDNNAAAGDDSGGLDVWLPLIAWTRYERGELMDLVRECHSVAAADEEQWREAAERMCKVAFLCVQQRPEARPAMSVVVSMLEGHSDVPAPAFPFGWMNPEPKGASSWSSSSGSDLIISVEK